LVTVTTVGCAQVDVTVNAFLAHGMAFPEPVLDSRVAVLATTDPAEPLLDQEIARKVKYLLTERGYSVADQEDADYVLFCVAGIDAGQRRRGVQAIQEPSRTITSYYYGRHGRFVRRSDYVPGRTHYVPYEYTVYMRSLTLELCDRRKLSGEQQEDLRKSIVWQCSAKSPGEEADLRWIVNHLLVAAFEHFGQDTGKERRVSVPYDDERVKELSMVTGTTD